ncbi:alanine/glycine:cation symporter family protein [Anaerocolumna sp. MB42-C2]|uniref:alanine/glycine:cation symporter family protein n=1 Tax=Anaerocolumna sp. MB42-C2 TaxID=3070997 RepID=UPI0027DFF6D2|nr:amino acid carrier protein [Anaerocolumna sp. MB42-C2]WMJ85925.1 amino acid carrier protein [Anaerocolumna sp. MB42-C2]
MIIILLATHLFLTFRLKFIQKKIGKGVRLSVKSSSSSDGETSSFGALTTTLAATLGIGNIIGVSTAVAMGGPGAILWIWLTGVLGMATTYAECYLGIHYRCIGKDGTYSGGPMYVLEKGLHSKPLAMLYCFLTLAASYGVGCSTQSNSITDVTSDLWGFPPYIVGLLTALITGLVIIGGIKSIGNICTKLVPAMGIFYMAACIILLVLNIDFLLPAIKLIIHSAFLPSAIAGGFIGSTIKTAARYGIARGLFSNEAGIGTAAIAASSAKTENPYNQALVSMSATFWDTVVMCGITGLVIVSHILKFPSSVQGASASELTTVAFEQIPFGGYILGLSIIAFATATLIGWSYFGEKAVVYLFGKEGINTYRICYLVMIFIGAILSLEFVWELSDLINAFMIIPNVLSIWLLYRDIKCTE